MQSPAKCPQPSFLCDVAASYNKPNKRKRHGKRGKKKPYTLAQAELALGTYEKGNRWKAIFHKIADWHHITKLTKHEIVVLRAEVLPSKTDAKAEVERKEELRFWFFGEDQHDCFILLYWSWIAHDGQVHAVESSLYTNNSKAGIDSLYRALFAAYINYVGSSHDEDMLFAIFTAYHRKQWERLIALDQAQQAKRAAVEPTRDLPSPLSSAPSPPPSPLPRAPTSDKARKARPALVHHESPEAVVSSADEQPVLSLEERVSKAHVSLPTISNRLALWGITQDSVDAYELDGGPKLPVSWAVVPQLPMRVACQVTGEILFVRCCVHWCQRRLHAWDKCYFFMHVRPKFVTGEMEVVCETCWPKMITSLRFPNATPPNFSFAPLSSLQDMITPYL